MSRGLVGALLLCLLGAVLLLAGAGATWSTLVLEGSAPLPDTTVRVSGADLVPGLRGLGVVALAGVPALLAVRRWGRVLVGGLLTGAGALAVVLVGGVLAEPAAAVSGSGAAPGTVLAVAEGARPPLSPWPYAVLVGGLVLTAAGLLAVVRGRTWPALGRRYEAPAGAAPAVPAGDKDVWEALDRGEDPTR